MIRVFSLAAGLLLSLAQSSAVLASVKPAKSLSAKHIVDRNVSARGGLEAWQALMTMAVVGTLYTGKQENAQLPIVVKLEVVAGRVEESRRMVFRDVAVNLSLADSAFSRPPSPQRADPLHHAPAP